MSKAVLEYIAASPAKEHGGFDERTVAAAKWALHEIADLEQWINDLQYGMYINCVYCGHRYGPREDTPVAMADVLREHIAQCPKHPLSAAKAEIASLLATREYQADTIRKLNAHIEYQESELARLRPLDIYLDDPRVLLEIPQPHRRKLSEMLHGREVSNA